MKKIILCLLVLVSCSDNTSVESQNLNQLLKPNFEYHIKVAGPSSETFIFLNGEILELNYKEKFINEGSSIGPNRKKRYYLTKTRIITNRC